MGGKYRFAEEGEKMLARAVREEQQEFGSFFLSHLLGMDVSYADDTCVVTFEAMEPMCSTRKARCMGESLRLPWIFPWATC